MSEKLAAYLEGARALLQVSAKSVARSLRMSDRTLAQLEKFADSEDSRQRDKIDNVIQLYRDLGLTIETTKADKKTRRIDVEHIALTEDVRRVVLCAQDCTDPDGTIQELRDRMRHVGGMVYSMKLTRKGRANRFDTLDAHFPTATRTMVCEILSDWVRDEPKKPLDLILVGEDGEAVQRRLTKDNADLVFQDGQAGT